MQQQMHMNMMNAAQQQVPPPQQQQQRLGAPKPAGGVAAQVIIDSDDEDEGNTNGNGQQQQQGMNMQGMQGNPNMMTMVRYTNIIIFWFRQFPYGKERFRQCFFYIVNLSSFTRN